MLLSLLLTTYLHWKYLILKRWNTILRGLNYRIKTRLSNEKSCLHRLNGLNTVKNRWTNLPKTDNLCGQLLDWDYWGYWGHVDFRHSNWSTLNSYARQSWSQSTQQRASDGCQTGICFGTCSSMYLSAPLAIIDAWLDWSGIAQRTLLHSCLMLLSVCVYWIDCYNM